MIINCDICDVIADIEILGYIKKDEWPDNVASFRYMSNPAKYCFHPQHLYAYIVQDSEKGIVKVGLWFAINHSACPYTYVDDLSLPLLYENGFITDFGANFEMLPFIIRRAIARKKPSFDTLAIIAKNNPALYEDIFTEALLRDNLAVIKWLYATNTAVMQRSLSELLDLDPSVEMMEFYNSTFPNWLESASAIVTDKINSTAFVYNHALGWLIKQINFDIKSLLVNNDGALMQNLLSRINNEHGVRPIRIILRDFTGVIRTLSLARLESIAEMINSKVNSYYFEAFMNAIPEAKLPRGQSPFEPTFI